MNEILHFVPTRDFYRDSYDVTSIVRSNNRSSGVFAASLILTLAIIRVPAHSTFTAICTPLVLW